MKKIILTLVTIFATGFAAMADTSLDQAYTSLSKLSGMSEKSVGTVQVDNNATLKNIKTSVVTANQGNVQDYRDKFIYMMENLPIRDMVIGANNQRDLAAVYAVPAGGGVYNVLIIQGNVLDGNFSTSYGQTNKAGVNAIRNCNLSMDGGELIFSPMAAGSANFISMTE